MKENTLQAISILEQHSKLLLNQTDITYEELQAAIKQLQDLEHYTCSSTGLWATDRPDLFIQQIQAKLMYKLDFWNCLEPTIFPKQSFAPYVDETVCPAKSYLVFCEKYSPWDEEKDNMVRVYSNTEAHKMLKILEKYLGIPNYHKANNE